ncbi:MAG TPA: hypothetical protein VK183_12020, partial [Flavobacterium sp.]|nr:hypothetical protein [Flavobacterium sp.]
MHQLFTAKYKGKEYYVLADPKDVEHRIERTRHANWTDFEKSLRRDQPVAYYEYQAQPFDGAHRDANETIDTLLIEGYTRQELEPAVYDILKTIAINEIVFSESRVDIHLPANLYNARRISCNGKTATGTLDLDQ